jgi:hypothetical protein
MRTELETRLTALKIFGVMPAQAGIHFDPDYSFKSKMDPRLRGNDDLGVIPPRCVVSICSRTQKCQ